MCERKRYDIDFIESQVILHTTGLQIWCIFKRPFYVLGPRKTAPDPVVNGVGFVTLDPNGLKINGI